MPASPEEIIRVIRDSHQNTDVSRIGEILDGANTKK